MKEYYNNLISVERSVYKNLISEHKQTQKKSLDYEISTYLFAVQKNLKIKHNYICLSYFSF